MYSHIRLARSRGKRRSDREIGGDAGVFGCLRLDTVGHCRRASVTAWGDDAQLRPLVAYLYEPQIVSIQGSAMMLRGYETEGSTESPGASFVQEWIIRLLLDPPASASGTERAGKAR